MRLLHALHAEWGTLQHPGCFLVLGCTTDDVKDWLGPQTYVTTLSNATDLSEIYALIEGFFLGMRRTMEVTPELLVSLEFGYPFKQAFDIICRGLGNPCALVRIPGGIMARDGAGSLSDSEIDQALDRLAPGLESMADTLAWPVFHIGERGERIILAGIMDRGNVAYVLVSFEGRRPFDSGEFSLVHCMCVFLRYYLREQERNDQRDSKESVFSDIILKNDLDQARILRRAAATRLMPEDEARVLLLLEEDDPAASRLALLRAARFHFPAPVVLSGRDVVCLVGKDGEELLSRFIAKGHTSAKGIFSLPVELPSDLRRGYRQCQAVAQISSFGSGGGGMLWYEDFALLDLIRHASTRMDLTRNLHPSAVAIVRNDAREGTEYAATLWCYLAHGQRVNETAEVLHVHRNTVIYRLERIGALFGASMSSLKDMEAMRTSLSILAIVDQSVELRGTQLYVIPAR